MTDNPFVAFRERYANNPVLMAREVLSFEADDAQSEVMMAVANGSRRLSVRSGHGTGKSCTLAILTVWHALTRFPQATVVTAPTSAQLFDALAAQTKAWFKKLPPSLSELFEVKAESITLKAAPEESFVSFRTSRPEMPEALAGVHSEHVLLIADEASGIPEQVYIAASGSMSGHNAVMILAGNPVRTSGLFFDTHHTLAAMWSTYHWSCVGHPRIAPDFVEDMKARYGEDTNDYRVRVLGEFPRAEADTVIPYDLLQLSLTREVSPTITRDIWGVDCARFGQDRSCLVVRRGNSVPYPPEVWKGLDTMALVGQIKHRWDTCPPLDRPETICVDAIGLGAGVADRLTELGLPARAINVSEVPSLGGNYVNLRAELYFLAKEWFAQRNCTLNNQHELAAELGWPRFTYTSSGKIKVEAKTDMKKRTKKSPDMADAFVLTFAVPAVGALYGSVGSSNWKEPLKREIKCLV